MDHRRPAAVIGALCVAVTVLGGPASAVAQAQPSPAPAVAKAQAQAQPGPRPRIEVTGLPVLSELPPLPAEGGPADSGEEAESSSVEMSGVQIFALALAGAVLVAGALGLALVTRRGRGEHAVGRGERPGPSGATPAR